MLNNLTRREQRVLLFLIGVITAGLAIHQTRNHSRRDIHITSPETEVYHQPGNETIRISEKTPLSPIPLVNINTASQEELCSLHGIGEVKAKIIIDYRNTHGEFKEPSEITKVPGIGMSTFEKIKASVTVGEIESTKTESENPGTSETIEIESVIYLKEKHLQGMKPGKININTADLEELMTLEQIGRIKAQRILEYRARFGPFHSVKDLLKIRGIGEKTLYLNKDKISLQDD